VPQVLIAAMAYAVAFLPLYVREKLLPVASVKNAPRLLAQLKGLVTMTTLSLLLLKRYAKPVMSIPANLALSYPAACALMVNV